MRANSMVAELPSACAFCGGELIFSRVPLIGTVETRCDTCGRRAPVKPRRPAAGTVIVPIDRAARLHEQRGSVTRRLLEQLPVGPVGPVAPIGAMTLRELIDAVRLSGGSVSRCLGKLQRSGRVTSTDAPRRGNLGPSTIRLYWRVV